MKSTNFLSGEILKPALWMALQKLNPKELWRNPVMFTVWIGSMLMLVITIWIAITGNQSQGNLGYNFTIMLLLWFTVFLGNLAEALAEARGKAQAMSLRQLKTTITAKKITGNKVEPVSSAKLAPGDKFICEAGDTIATDGEIVEGIAMIDESAITGESAPVLREAGGDRSAVTGGTLVISDRVVVQVTAMPGQTFLDKMIALVEGAKRQKTPNEQSLQVLLVSFTIVFLVVTVAIQPMGLFLGVNLQLASLVALFVCLIPTTIGALLSAIGIAGMDRALQAHLLAKSGKAIETAGDVDVIMLDKTGTITIGNRRATAFHGVTVSTAELAKLAAQSSLHDDTPEGKSILQLAETNFQFNKQTTQIQQEIPFTAQTRSSGVVLTDGTAIQKGAMDSMQKLANNAGHNSPAQLQEIVTQIAKHGGTPLVVSVNAAPVGVIELQDVLKPGMEIRFERLRKMGVKTVMVTGDNPLTAAYIARTAGLDDFIAEAKPEDKLLYMKQLQQQGHLVAMMGDGTNDAPALAQADVGVAMNSGTAAAKEAGNMVDLDNDPTKLIEIIEIGKQLLITRGSLTTFSIANDVAKYFAVLPAMFAPLAPGLKVLDIMSLGSPQSAILSAVIFNALIIPALVPLALNGVQYKPIGASALLTRNLTIYGLGGIVLPFVGIKAIDLVVSLFV